MEELQYGPNGGLIFCLEYLLENMEWLTSDLGAYQDEFLIVDCPGQIEIFTHSNIMSRIVEAFRAADYKPCALYLLESLFLLDVCKFFSGVLTATSAMLQLGIPHLNAISKMDLLRPHSTRRSEPIELASAGGGEDEDDEDVEDELHRLHRYFYPDPTLLAEQLRESTPSRYLQLNQALVQLVDEYDMVNFIPLNSRSARSLDSILMHIELATQYSEALEPREPRNDDSWQEGDEEGEE